MRRRAQFPDRARAGVYLIKESGVIVYVGYSGYDVYKTMYRHFQEWNHQTQEVVTYNADSGRYTVRVIYCTPQQAAALELALIKRHNPRDNADKYNAVQLDAKARRALESYQDTEAEAPKFSDRELKVMEEDRAYFEELKAGGAAIFGVESDRYKYKIKVIDSENKTIAEFFPHRNTLAAAIETLKIVLDKYNYYKNIRLDIYQA